MTLGGNGVGRAGAADLVVSRVTKRFGGLLAVNDITLELSGPGIIGLVGQNGAGKSTLLSLLSGSLRPSSGDIFFKGSRISRRPRAGVAKLGICRMFQEVRLVSTLRVWENISLGSGVHDKSRRARHLDAVVASAISVGLAESDLDRWPHELSIGAQRRIELGRLLLSKPRVALLDEPTANLSASESEEVASVIKALAQSSLVILVEHNMQLVYTIGERVIVLMEGRVAADGPPSEVAQDAAVRSAYLGHTTAVQ